MAETTLDPEQAAAAADPEPSNTDGRRLRRDRNRATVVDALLALYGEGNLDPSAAQIAERAGLSPRSLFRYFDDVDDLAREAINTQHGRALHLTIVAAEPRDPFDDRVRALVAQRMAMWEAVRGAASVARLRAPFRDVVAIELTRNRAHFRRQIEELFAAELHAFEPAHARAVLAGCDALTSFESHQLLRFDQEMKRGETEAILIDAVTTLFTRQRTAR